ncbi:MAG: hypothetical protein VYD64_02985, partial [Pseudomonadota bacterium]|nr:hypothetical protein [Pseudomonadota bacterium]
MTEQNSLAREYSFDTNEEDPLEELARIVSGEKKPAPKPGSALARPSFDDFKPTLPAAEAAPAEAGAQEFADDAYGYEASADDGAATAGAGTHGAQDDSLEYDLETELLHELENVSHEDAYEESTGYDGVHAGTGHADTGDDVDVDDDGSLEDQLMVELGISDEDRGHSGEFLTGFEDEVPPSDAAGSKAAASEQAHDDAGEDAYAAEDGDDDYENETHAALRESLGLAGDFKDKFEAEMAINRAAEALNMDARRYQDNDDSLDDIEFDPSIWDVEDSSGDTEITLEQLMAPAEPPKPVQPARAEQPPRAPQPAPQAPARHASARAVDPGEAVDHDIEVHDDGARPRQHAARPQQAPGPARSQPAQAGYASHGRMHATQQPERADAGRALAPVTPPAAPATMFNSEREIDEHFAAVFAEELGFDDPAPAPAPALRQPGAAPRAPVPAAPARREAAYAPPPAGDGWDDARYEEQDQAEIYADEYDDEAYEDAYEEDYGDHYPEEQLAPRASGSRGFRLAGIALGLALVVGLGAVSYGYFKGGGAPSEPVLVRAEQDPVKTRPED